MIPAQPGDTELYQGGCAMKHPIILASLVCVLFAASACTREKPDIATPAPAAPQVISPIPSAPTPSASGVATPTAVVLATLAPTEPATLVPPTAVPTLAPTSAPIPASAPGTYVVQWGDWLNKIAARFGVSPQALLAANPGLNPNRIYPGQVLNIPGAGASIPTPTPPSGQPPATGPTTYTVQNGDWIYAIARKFGISVPALLAANPGINPNFVYPGQVLNIPGSGTPGTTPPGTGTGSQSYTVKPGDTLFSIAVRFHTTTYAIQIANHLANPHFIYPGQTLIIPQQ
jgi:LysM repeat protein